MKKVKVESFTISGIKTRTNNKNETQVESSKIAPLWEDFFKKEIPKRLNSHEIYGVYYNYENDARGEFDVLAGVKIDDGNFEKIVIEEGDYPVFCSKGQMPQIVIDTWGKVWSYFDVNPKEQRAYRADFEKYIGEDEIEIYIGI